jgi:hypothetical protein
MELTKKDVETTLIRLQGQIDVWQNLHRALLEAEKAAEHIPMAAEVVA